MAGGAGMAQGTGGSAAEMWKAGHGKAKAHQKHPKPGKSPHPKPIQPLLHLSWTRKVCRIMAFYRYWAIILPIF